MNHFKKNVPDPYQRKIAKPNPYGAEPASGSALVLMSPTNILMDSLGKTGTGMERMHGWD